MKNEQGEDIQVFINKADKGFPNEKKYIIDAKWWRSWCDFAGFEIIERKQS